MGSPTGTGGPLGTGETVQQPEGSGEGTETPEAESYEGQGVTASGEACLTNRDYLALEAWTTVMQGRCITCHGPGGLAQDENAEFVLQPPAYPGFLDENLANISKVSKNENEGVSILLRKPLGELEHGGGPVITADSEEYQILSSLIDRLGMEDSCEEGDVTSLDDVTLLGPAETFRKAALQLNGRLPTAEEIQQLQDGGEDALPGLVRSLFGEEAFYDRLVEVFNDQFLTDRYMGNSQGVLSNEDFPYSGEAFDMLTDEERNATRRSIAREPLELMAYIVKNDRPFTEIVTADYTVMNGYSATVFNNNPPMAPFDEHDYFEGKIWVDRGGEWVTFPHAGILTSPMFLNRYPTSRTNRNRHRARIVLREFLATDILKIAERPIDPTKAVALANPTREDPACKTCHVIIDPIAGAFQKWDDNDYERYRPDREWFEEMFLPGFGEEQMQVVEYAEAQQWLGQRIASDKRFPLSVVRNALEGLTGHAPLEFPEDPRSAGYIAWQAQDATIRTIAEAFVDSGFNYKTVVEMVVLSPYYRAANTSATDATRLGQLTELGTGTLLTPELLNRKMLATLGFTWGNANDPVLLDEFRILYGGIDSDGVTERLRAPNGLMSAIMWRMANEVSCRGTSYDFAKAQESRLLFPHVTTDTVPEDEFGQTVDDNVAAIRQNIRYLFDRLLGVSIADDAEEMDTVYGLFLDTWKEGRGRINNESVGRNLTWQCQYRQDLLTGMDVPEEERLAEDADYVIRSWMAVMTYFLADYRFLYE